VKSNLLFCAAIFSIEVAGLANCKGNKLETDQEKTKNAAMEWMSMYIPERDLGKVRYEAMDDSGSGRPITDEEKRLKMETLINTQGDIDRRENDRFFRENWITRFETWTDRCDLKVRDYGTAKQKIYYLCK
jgi:hypothetical protein